MLAEACGHVDDVNKGVALLVARIMPAFPDPATQRVRLEEFTTKRDLIKQIERGDVENDLDPGRLQWAKSLLSAMLNHVKAVKSQQQSTSSGSLPDAKASRPELSSLFSDVSGDGANIAYSYDAPAAGEASSRTPQPCPFILQDNGHQNWPGQKLTKLLQTFTKFQRTL